MSRSEVARQLSHKVRVVTRKGKNEFSRERIVLMPRGGLETILDSRTPKLNFFRDLNVGNALELKRLALLDRYMEMLIRLR